MSQELQQPTEKIHSLQIMSENSLKNIHYKLLNWKIKNNILSAPSLEKVIYYIRFVQILDYDIFVLLIN